MVKNIVFDFGGVLLDWNPRYLYRDYFKDDTRMEYFLGNICTLDWNAEQDKGRPFKEGVALLQAEFPHSDIPEGVELLKELKAKGYGIYGLTNWSSETIGFAFGRYDFFSLFEGIVVSGDEKLLKPDPRIYEVLLSRYGLKADECVFLDDNAANVDGARTVGMKSVRFDDISRVREELSSLLGSE